MAINDFEFPGVELHQEFVETPVTGVSQLEVVVIGQQYKVSEITDVAVTAGAATVISLPATEGVIDDTSDVASIIVRNGLYPNGSAIINTGDAAVKLTGGTFAASGRNVELTFNARLTSGAAANTAFGYCKPTVGGTIDVITDGNTNGISSVIESVDGNKVVAVPSTGTYTTSATVTGVQFYAQFDAAFTPTAKTSNSMTLAATPTALVPGKTTGAVALESGEYTVDLKYQNLNDELLETRKLGTIGSEAEIRSLFGVPCVENPVALALLFALYAGVENQVHYLLTNSESVSAYEDAMDILAKYPSVYSVVPMTTDAGVIGQLVAKAERDSANAESKTRSTVWYGVETNAADIIGSALDFVAAVGNSFRAQAVWADDAMFNGQIVPNYILAAAPAGMRSYEPTYRPISNLPYNFFSLKNTNELTKSALETLGSNGIWIIANNYDGTPTNLRQITSAASNNLNKDEESIVANADSIALTLCRVGENLVGCSNISPDLLVALHDTLTGIMDRYLLNLTGNAYIGPQLLSYTIDRLEQDPVRLDHIYATITCEPPKPFNRFVMTLRIV